MALYSFDCPACGAGWDDSAPMHGAKVSTCPQCGSAGRRAWTAPVIDCLTFGKNGGPNRTPLWRQRPRDEYQAQTMREARLAAGAGTVFGQVPGQRKEG